MLSYVTAVWFWRAAFLVALLLNLWLWVPRPRPRTRRALGPCGVYVEPCNLAGCELRKRLGDCMVHRGCAR